jgi:hypothetical protein
VFKLLDQDLQRAMAEDIPGAPGLSQTPTRYGETFSVTPSAMAPAPTPPAATLPGLTPPTPAPTPTQPVVAPAAGGLAPPAVTVTARRRARVNTAVAAPPEPVLAPELAPELTPVLAAGGGSPGPPPPPGMKPPARLPS